MQDTMLDTVVSSNSQELSDASASSAIKLFENPQFRVRVIMRCAEPWFVAKDVATCIEHKDVSTMCKLCREKDKVVESASNFDSADLAESGNSRITLISEYGLYRILAKCNLPKCEPFELWVFDNVPRLPRQRQSRRQLCRAEALRRFIGVLFREAITEPHLDFRVRSLSHSCQMQSAEMRTVS